MKLINQKQVSIVTLIVSIFTLTLISACTKTADNQGDDKSIMSNSRSGGQQPGTAASSVPQMNSGISSDSSN